MLSQNPLFPGLEIEKPKLATRIYDAEGEPIFRCPHCGDCAHVDDCDVLGAEPGCVFCNQCNREFEMP